MQPHVFDRKAYFRGQTITRQGQPVSRIILVTKGSVVVRIEGDSRSFIFGPGTLLGFRCIVEGLRDPVFRSTAVASTQVDCVSLNAVELAREYHHIPATMKKLFQATFASTDAIIKAYQMDSRRRRRLLAELSTEISLMLKSEEG